MEWTAKAAPLFAGGCGDCVARSEEDEGAGVVFVYVVMCMAVGNEGLWGGAGEVVDRFCFFYKLMNRASK
ncbi:hypothetical protein Peur_068075 [Populus x canadensis]